ncbi:nucleoside:proton symporter [Rhodoblastus sphagnicola]|uniref:Nucleoside:proton symporter n=1 Tax=Rhodoblastus sphagnicola TaxID=333368 RepID=A0A2S6MYT5_9HYPH|nr:nucleoside transporter C-terminal domain-containing protein [Rhodoblastus sphagnicola]MBB4196443.1 CNT family concentrative nucleoside transporter [Rhodoblastus sphagnicola]PPQ27518.1 nucleoside:proton symporter [Rhodoblastus sphagnicola]
MSLIHGCFALVVLLGVAGLLSENRRAISPRIVVAGVALQVGLAILLLKVPAASAAMAWLAGGVGALDRATEAGTGFVFGYVGGAPLPFDLNGKGSTLVLAFRVFPMILVVCALASLLFHWGVLQRVVAGMALVLRRALGVGGALGTGAAVNVFVGMIESPILVRPYLANMHRGELFSLMSVGMAGIAGTVMAIYGHILSPVVPDSFAHILTAALISAPAAIAVAAIMVPFPAKTEPDTPLVVADPPRNALEAISRGTSDGIVILANVLASIVVLLSLVALANSALGALPDFLGAPLSLQRLLSWLFLPFAWLIGIEPADLATSAKLLGEKTVLNEFVAFLDLARESALSPRSRLILTYALCGFANFGSLGIMVGGLSAMAPERKRDVIAMGFRAMIAGTLASLMDGALIGALT